VTAALEDQFSFLLHYSVAILIARDKLETKLGYLLDSNSDKNLCHKPFKTHFSGISLSWFHQSTAYDGENN